MKTQYPNISNDSLNSVTGGSLTVSSWSDYLSAQVLPILNGLMNGASENDKSVLQNILKTLKNTQTQASGVADTVKTLWATYNFIYRPSLQSSKIQVTLDQKLYSAQCFADSLR